ncbi:MAG: tRNA (adenosine(37)-N6)-dimethylallyltransferase MiaA [Candidatus Liptonbacteria bacterium]|nr:tRNA (adenosine(37)-N6)-dimethylallyltransferase MiaA [Candidatus Liptonbacteria bacterium]
MNNESTVIAIVGPTASGKSDLAVRLALWLSSPMVKKELGTSGAEIISADSRQVYRGMDIGTGKIPRDKPVRSTAYRIQRNSGSPPSRGRREEIPTTYHILPTTYLSSGIPHHLLDVASPRRIFTAAHYQELARKAIGNIVEKNKIPIICGGTGFYIDAALYDYALPDIPPNLKLRRMLEKKTANELFAELQALDPIRGANIDRYNKRRLVRALEIIAATKKPVPSPEEALRRTSRYKLLKIGVAMPEKKLALRIRRRLFARLRNGMIAEVARLHKNGVGWKRLDDLGLEYRFIAKYLQGMIGKNEMISALEAAIRHYAKRQMTWFKKDKEIKWLGTERKTMAAVKKFLQK